MLDMSKEIYKDIPGYEGMYQVSNYGNVWSFKTQKILAPCQCGKGHKRVHLTKSGVRADFLIHRLVAQAFLGLDINDRWAIVNHLDQNPSNNRADNLEITTTRGNLMYSAALHPERENSAHKVAVYDESMSLIKEYDCQATLARELGLDKAAITARFKYAEYPIIKGHYCLVKEGSEVPESFPYPNTGIKVTNKETGQINYYVNRRYAAAALEVNVSTISRWLDRDINDHQNKSKTDKYKIERLDRTENSIQ